MIDNVVAIVPLAPLASGLSIGHIVIMRSRRGMSLVSLRGKNETNELQTIFNFSLLAGVALY